MNHSTSEINSEFRTLYGINSRLCSTSNPKLTLVLSQDKKIDLIELEQLLESVGWSRRPLKLVKRALENSLIKVGLWRHDRRIPRLIGFARCTGDGVIEATIWDVAVHPRYQGIGLGNALMRYVIDTLNIMKIERVSLFADPEVLQFYIRQGWELEPNKRRCAFCYSS
uniref:Possible acetyltransferase n=1 Tax=Paulinella chromatophora TaxID=39717 RepID=B1X5W2_PAUCH|nr:possible acetyltransferase [Paulinella chromatophora]ACB43331.1 possible acetyltransferase [Paulinella chromatophora]